MHTFSRLGRAASVTAVAVAMGLGAITVAAPAHAYTSSARSVAASQAYTSSAIINEYDVCGCALT
jgi:hypothetical protein